MSQPAESQRSELCRSQRVAAQFAGLRKSFKTNDSGE